MLTDMSGSSICISFSPKTGFFFSLKLPELLEKLLDNLRKFAIDLRNGVTLPVSDHNWETFPLVGDLFGETVDAGGMAIWPLKEPRLILLKMLQSQVQICPCTIYIYV